MRRVALLLVVLLAACSGSVVIVPTEQELPQRRVSPYEVDTPYVGEPDFWDRADLYVMRPDVEPLDLWPDEVQNPSAHGIRIIVLLPGDYRNRSNGSLGPGVLYIPDSGTAEAPLLVTYAPAEGADILAAAHPAERMGESEALLTAFRIWNETYQYFHGLTFRDGISACLMRETSGSVIDRCLWHETRFQPLRIRFGANDNLIQRCVMRRFKRDEWGAGDTVAIQISDGACTHNRIVSNVILNYTDSFQHTDRDGEDYGLSAGTVIDNNFFGFTPEAYVQAPEGELLCGENALDFKMGGTEAEPVLVTNNVFFGARAAQTGCAASGSGGYAVTMHRRGTWIEMTDNLFVDNDSGIFLNAFFLNVEQAQGRIDPRLTIARNVFVGVRSYATAFPSRTGHVLTGTSPARFFGNRIVACDRLMEREALVGELAIENNEIFGDLELAPRDRARLLADGNVFGPAPGGTPTILRVPWTGRTLEYVAPQ